MRTREAAGLPETSTTSKGRSRPFAPSPLWEDDRLVRACLGGDEDAWAALISKYQRMIYSVPVRYGAPPQDAADIFQQVCVELFSELQALRKVESLRSWLLTVASHQSLRWKKSRTRSELPLDDGEDDHPSIEPQDSQQLAPERLLQIEMEQVLRESIRKLAPRCSTLVQMLFYSDQPLPYAEVARQLGLATGSIGFIRGRCLASLRRILSEAGFQ